MMGGGSVLAFLGGLGVWRSKQRLKNNDMAAVQSQAPVG